MNLKNVFLSLVFIACAALPVYGALQLRSSRRAEALTHRGVEAYVKGDIAKAEKSFIIASRENPAYSAAWLNLGLVSEKLGKYGEAVDAYENFLNRSHDGEAAKTARLRLAEIYSDDSVAQSVRKPDWPKKAVYNLELLVKAEPDNPEYHLRLGFAAFKAINPGRGFAEFKKASRLAAGPKQIGIHTELMSFYMQINMMNLASDERKIVERLSGAGGSDGKTGKGGTYN